MKRGVSAAETVGTVDSGAGRARVRDLRKPPTAIFRTALPSLPSPLPMLVMVKLVSLKLMNL